MPAWFLIVAAAFLAAGHSDAPRGCYWETRHAPVCEAYTAWLKQPHPHGARYVSPANTVGTLPGDGS